MSEDTIVVANAPISYGAFELTVGIDPAVPDAEALLDLVASAGYAGIDLGPVGFLGVGDQLRERLESRGLGLAGGYLELPFSDPDLLDAHLPELDALLDVFDHAPSTHPAPRPTLADAGSSRRRQNPARAATDPGYGLDELGWQRFGVGLQRAVDHCRSRGFEPTLHPEAGTHVEARWEIDRALESADIGLCLETGHELVGGGDPLSTLEDWGRRINHVHLKDAAKSVIDKIVEDGEPVEAIWSRRAFPRLGQGDVPVEQILQLLLAQGYSGWLVVEQDIMPGPGDPDAAQTDQVANRSVLTRQGM